MRILPDAETPTEPYAEKHALFSAVSPLRQRADKKLWFLPDIEEAESSQVRVALPFITRMNPEVAGYLLRAFLKSYKTNIFNYFYNLTR